MTQSCPLQFQFFCCKKRLIGYARVSTYGQTLGSQLEELRAAGCTNVGISTIRRATRAASEVTNEAAVYRSCR
jgi:hypothetical protein